MRTTFVVLLTIAGLCATAVSADSSNVLQSVSACAKPDGGPVPVSGLQQEPGGPRLLGPPLDPGGDPTWLTESMIPNNSNRSIATCANNGFPMVVATNGVRHVVWYDANNHFTYYQRYYPASNTWTPETTIFGTSRSSWCPMIALDSDGTTIHVVTCDASASDPPPGSHIYYKRCTPTTSGNGGWDPTVTVDDHPANHGNQSPYVACGPRHHVAIAWNEYVSGAFYAEDLREVIDGAWQSTVRLDSTGNSDSLRGVGGVAVLADGDVCVLSNRARRSAPGVGDYWFLRRIGGVWQPPEDIPLDPNPNFKWYTCMAVDPTTGFPHVGWCMSDWSPQGRQVWHNWRDNDGWHIADSISRKKNLTWWMDQPSFAFTPDGVLTCVWSENTDAGPTGVAFRQWHGGTWGEQEWVYESGAPDDDNACHCVTDAFGNVYVVTQSCRRMGRASGVWDLFYRDRVTIPASPHGWSARASLPTAPSGRFEGQGGWLAYDAGTGLIFAAKGENTGDFYAFDPGTNAWSELAPIPAGPENKLPRDGCRGVADGADRVYMTKGANTLGFWSYTISTRTWTPLAAVPPGKQRVKGGTDLAYVVTDGVGYVYLLKGQECEFYRYNTQTGQWSRLADAPRGKNGKWLAGSWLVYDGDRSLYAHKALSWELYRFDVSTGAWDPAVLAGMPPRSSILQLSTGGCAAWLYGAIYALKGNNTREFWRYDPGEDAWTALDDMPLGGSCRRVHGGGDITATPGIIFAFKGSQTNELWRYVRQSERPSGDGVSARTTVLPTELALSVSPNPMRLSTAIHYAVPIATHVSLKLYDISGALAETVSSGVMQPGRYAATLSAKGLARGVYILKLKSDAGSLVRKVVVE